MPSATFFLASANALTLILLFCFASRSHDYHMEARGDYSRLKGGERDITKKLDVLARHFKLRFGVKPMVPAKPEEITVEKA